MGGSALYMSLWLQVFRRVEMSLCILYAKSPRQWWTLFLVGLRGFEISVEKTYVAIVGRYVGLKPHISFTEIRKELNFLYVFLHVCQVSGSVRSSHYGAFLTWLSWIETTPKTKLLLSIGPLSPLYNIYIYIICINVFKKYMHLSQIFGAANPTSYVHSTELVTSAWMG